MGNDSSSQGKDQEEFDDQITSQFLKQFQLYKDQNNLEVKSLSHGGKLAIFQRKTQAFASEQKNHKDLISLNFQSLCKQKASNQLESLKNHINYYKKRINLVSDRDTDTMNSIVKLFHFSIKNETTNQLIYPQIGSLWKPTKREQPIPKRQLVSCGFENIFKKSEEKQPSISTFKKQIYRMSFVQEFNMDSLQKEIRFRKANGQLFKQKEIWSIVYCCSKAANKMILQGLKQPVLSPASIFINQNCEIKVSQWQFVNYYIAENNQIEEESPSYEQGETFLTNQLQMTLSKNSTKQQTDILMRYYWPPEGLVEMQNILRLGELQKDKNDNQKLYEAKNSQVFCLAMTTLNLLTLKPYYQKATYSQKQLTKLVEQAIEIRQHTGQPMSQEIVDLLLQMLQWDPLERFRYSDTIEYIHQVYQSNETIFNETSAYASIQLRSARSEVDGSEPTDSETNRFKGETQNQQNLSKKLYKHQDNPNNKLILIDQEVEVKIDRLEDSGIMWPGKGDDYNPHRSDDETEETLPNHHKKLPQSKVLNHYPLENNFLNSSLPDLFDTQSPQVQFPFSQQFQYPDEDIDYEGGEELCQKYQQNLLSEQKRYVDSLNLNHQPNSIQNEFLTQGQQFYVFQYVPQNWDADRKGYENRESLKEMEINFVQKNQLKMSRDSLASFNLKFLNRSNEDLNMKKSISFDPLFSNSQQNFSSPPQNIYVNNLSTIVKQTMSPRLQKTSENKENVFGFDSNTNQENNNSNIFTSENIMEMIRQFTRKECQQTPDFNAIQLTNEKLKLNSSILKNSEASKKLSFDEKPSLFEKKFDICYGSNLFESPENKLFPSYESQNHPKPIAQTNLLATDPTVRIEFAKGTYEGSMKNSLRNGYGTFYYKQGGKYSGYWYNNKMDGHGTLYYPDGRVAYQGQWQNDSLHGKGILYNEKPVKIQARYNFTSFDQCDENQCWVTYDGWFENDQKCGFGELLLSNREKYVGEFRNDMVHGRGKFYNSDGSIVEGIWSQNHLLQQY